MNGNKLELKTLIDGFRLSCLAEGKSAKTVEWYVNFLNRFLRFLEARQLSTDLGEIGRDKIRDFVRFLQTEVRNPRNGKPLSGATVQGYVRTLKAFSSWAVREEYIPPGHFGRIRVPKAQSKMINTFSSEQVRQLVSLCQASNSNGPRNLAILLLLLDTGLRVSELANIDLDDVKLEEGSIKIRVAKGGRERIVPIGSLVQKVLWRYIIHFRPEPIAQSENYLFLTLDGKPLQANAVKLLIKRWGKKANVPRLHAHLCRHTFATNFLIQNCGDVFRLQQILGHTSLEMVRRYVHYASTQTMISGNPSSPLDLMGIKKLNGYKIDRMLKDKNTNNDMATQNSRRYFRGHLGYQSKREV